MVNTLLADRGLQSSILVDSGGSRHLLPAQGCEKMVWQGEGQERFSDSLMMALASITGPQCPPPQRSEALMTSARSKVWKQKFG